MDVRQRMQLVRLIEQIEQNPSFSKRIGTTNTSIFISENEKQKQNDQNPEGKKHNLA